MKNFILRVLIMCWVIINIPIACLFIMITFMLDLLVIPLFYWLFTGKNFYETDYISECEYVVGASEWYIKNIVLKVYDKINKLWT